MKHPILGILGGLGPASGSYFYDMVIRHTVAERDSDHIDVLLSGCASTPDRTGFILGKSDESPLPDMLDCAEKLASIGADMIAIPCNTAHYFYDSLSEGLSVPVVNIIKETVDYIRAMGVSTVGVLATDGTVESGAYAKVCEDAGVKLVTPIAEDQAQIMSIIYDDIKAGRAPDMDAFYGICRRLQDAGCERIVLGCTELSLLMRDYDLDREIFVDSLEVLACRCITLCGRKAMDFHNSLIEYTRN